MNKFEKKNQFKIYSYILNMFNMKSHSFLKMISNSRFIIPGNSISSMKY